MALNVRLNPATFSRLSAIRRYMISALSVLLVNATGCLFPVGIPANRFEQAERLVGEGTQALKDRRLEDAQAAFSLSWELAPLAAALDGQGCVALLQGDLSGAESFFRRAYESDVTYDEALGHLALMLEASGRSDEALRMYDELLALHPDAAEARNNRAALAFDLGLELPEVEEELRKAALVLGPGVASRNLEVVRQVGRSVYGKEGN